MIDPSVPPRPSAPKRDWSFVLGFGFTLFSVAVFLAVVRGRAAEAAPEAVVHADLVLQYKDLGLLRSRGSPARDTLVEVTDYLCSACAAAHHATEAVVDSMVKAGRLVHLVIETPYQSGARAVSVAASCAWADPKADFWRFRQVLFDAQRAIAAAYPVEAELQRVGGFAGIAPASLASCQQGSGDSLTGVLDRGLATARASSISYTPVFSLNGTTVRWSDLPERLRGLRAQ